MKDLLWASRWQLFFPDPLSHTAALWHQQRGNIVQGWSVSRLVSTVFEKRLALKELFEHIIEHHDEYDEDTVCCADEYNAKFCFLLSTFYGIFEYSNVLFGILQNKALHVKFCLAIIDVFCERERGRFGEIYESTVCETGEPRTRGGQAQGDIRARYQKLHNDILDNILAQTRNWFKDHEKVMLLSLLDPQHCHTGKNSSRRGLLQFNTEPLNSLRPSPS